MIQAVGRKAGRAVSEEYTLRIGRNTQLSNDV